MPDERIQKEFQVRLESTDTEELRESVRRIKSAIDKKSNAVKVESTPRGASITIREGRGGRAHIKGKKGLVEIRSPIPGKTVDTLAGLILPEGVQAEIVVPMGAHGVGAGDRPDEESREIVVLKEALRILGSPAELGRWIQTPVPSLGGRTPYSLLGSEEGRRQVEDVLGRIEHGVY